MDALRHARYESPVGTLWVARSEKGLAGLHLRGDEREALALWERGFGARSVRDDAALTPTLTQLEAYFAGARTRFEMPLDLRGTPFQQRCWAALQTIPYGETRSYKWLAQEVGSPQGARAVGMANHANPVAIVVPCHRIVNADGGLGGYGGGLDMKRKLLRLEGALPERQAAPRARAS
jgi:methylated-DNA-[protein]-cysteine S-methyltransferase